MWAFTVLNARALKWDFTELEIEIAACCSHGPVHSYLSENTWENSKQLM